MVPDHWSNNAMVSMDRFGLIDTVKLSMKEAQAEANRKMVETIDILC